MTNQAQIIKNLISGFKECGAVINGPVEQRCIDNLRAFLSGENPAGESVWYYDRDIRQHVSKRGYDDG